MPWPDDRQEPFSAELRLLLCCARLHLDQAVRGEIARIASQPLEWEGVLALASQHGLEPLMHKHFGETQFANIPGSVRDTLARHSKHAALLNLKRLGELFAVLDLLADKQISAIPYKGPVLAQLLYGNVALRRCYDLDIVVAPGDVLQTVELLKSRGYRQCTNGEPDLRYNNEYGLVNDDGVIVEIHWALLPPNLPLRLDYAELRDHEVPIVVQGRSVCRLSDDLLLVALSAHGAKHHWDRLMWICDVALLVQRMASAAPALGMARRTGTARALICGLELARRLLGCSLPQDATDAIAADPAARAMAQWIIANVITGNGVIRNFRSHAYLLRSRERPSDRLRYVAVLARRPSWERRMISLPAPLQFLYILMKASRYLTRAFSAKAIR